MDAPRIRKFKMVFVLSGMGLAILFYGCVMFEQGKSGVYVPGAQQVVVSREIDYMDRNLLNSDRVVTIDMYGRPDAYNEKVVFLANIGQDELDDFNYEIFVARYDGSGQRRLTFTPEVNELQPEWTQRGRIIYATLSPRKPYPQYYLMNGDGTGARSVSRKEYEELKRPR